MGNPREHIRGIPVSLDSDARADINASTNAPNIALARSLSASSPSRYLPSQAAASIVEGTVTVILLKLFAWELRLEVDAVTAATGGPPTAHTLVHHSSGLNSTDRSLSASTTCRDRTAMAWRWPAGTCSRTRSSTRSARGPRSRCQPGSRGAPGPSVSPRLQKSAELLVVGSRGRGALTEVLLGSVSEHCVLHSPCPVVVLRHHSDPA